MVSIAKTQYNQRESILLSLFNIESLLEYVKEGSQHTVMGCTIISRALEKIYSTLFTAGWEDQVLPIRALNMAIRGIVYDIMDHDLCNLEIFDEMIRHSRALEEELAWI